VVGMLEAATEGEGNRGRKKKGFTERDEEWK
jgi:hypothetical protein